MILIRPPMLKLHPSALKWLNLVLKASLKPAVKCRTNSENQRNSNQEVPPTEGLRLRLEGLWTGWPLILLWPPAPVLPRAGRVGFPPSKRCPFRHPLISEGTYTHYSNTLAPQGLSVDYEFRCFLEPFAPECHIQGQSPGPAELSSFTQFPLD